MIAPIVTRGFGSGGSIALVATRGYSIGEAVAPAVAFAYSGGWESLRRRKRVIEEPVEAIEVVLEDGTAAERERAAQIEADRLLWRLAHEKALLDATQKRAARAQARWVIEVAHRIERERDDEDLALVALLMD